MANIRTRAKTDPWALPNLMNVSVPEEKRRTSNSQEKELQQALAAEPVTPVFFETAGKGYWGLGIAACVIIGVSVAVARIVRIRRRNRL